MTPSDFAQNIADCEILVASPSAFSFLSREHMQALPKLKLITTTSVGVDWLDLEATSELGIIVSNQKGVNAQSVAEHCLGMVLSLSKRITETDRNMRKSTDLQMTDYEGVELAGKTLGIIGLGDIGTRVAKLGAVLFAKTLAFNRSEKDVDGVENVGLETLLENSDVVIVCVPLTNKTEGMIASSELSSMKAGSLLISISREKVINKDAVLEAVSSKKLRGFALDADIAVPLALNDPYFQYDNIVVTPHSASMTKESYERYASMTVENIQAFMEGEPVRVVNN